MLFLQKLVIFLNYFFIILIYLVLVSIFTANNKDKPLVTVYLIRLSNLILKYFIL